MFFKKILVPVDGSKHALLAKRRALAIAESMDSEIVLVHVLDRIPAIIGGHAREELRKEMKVEAQKVFEQYTPGLEAKGIKYKTRIESGRPFDAICTAAKEEACDLICLGARGLSEVEGMLLGSVSSAIISHCAIPVLVVR
ncbi:universal stress protein [Halodesulfovibrio aestuarii]|uniref:Universal stress protein n=1 Tax=Halodesulfovibrio aestuarii TaxID=126333 RepID=A0A8G2CAS1_9BACT|nr:universal stress protein [Halodesulfovibrio aestuarii]SHJ38606.1 Nucleotide-binding universal stress protein, UspA family [Halodesulfovibrio aestuarii]